MGRSNHRPHHEGHAQDDRGAHKSSGESGAAATFATGESERKSSMQSIHQGKQFNYALNPATAPLLMDAQLDYLVGLGLKSDEVCNMASISVVLIGLNPETRLRPVVEYLKARGVPGERPGGGATEARESGSRISGDSMITAPRRTHVTLLDVLLKRRRLYPRLQALSDFPSDRPPSLQVALCTALSPRLSHARPALCVAQTARSRPFC